MRRGAEVFALSAARIWRVIADPPARRFDLAARDLGMPAGAWIHPTGEQLDFDWIHFTERAG